MCALAVVERGAVLWAILRGKVPRRGVRGGTIGSRDAPPLTQRHGGVQLGSANELKSADSGKQNRQAKFLINNCNLYFFYLADRQLPLEAVDDFARDKYLLRVECECGRVVLSDPQKVIAAC